LLSDDEEVQVSDSRRIGTGQQKLNALFRSPLQKNLCSDIALITFEEFSCKFACCTTEVLLCCH